MTERTMAGLALLAAMIALAIFVITRYRRQARRGQRFNLFR